MKKTKVLGKSSLFVLIITTLFSYKNIYASIKPEVEINENTGTLTFVTTDTKASTETTWETVGFNICREKTNGNPLKDTDGISKTKDYATIWLRDGERKEVVLSNTKVQVRFTLNEDTINKALKGTGLETIQDNDIIYLNGIFRVLHNGVAQPGYYRTLSAIKNAEAWNNPDDFDDRFDVPVLYHSSNILYPVSIDYKEYYNGARNLLLTEDLGDKRSQTTVTTNWQNIPMKRVENGREEFLYRVCYVNLSEPNKILGIRKTVVNPYYYYQEYLDQLDYIRNRTFIVKKGGLKIVATYKTFPRIKNEANTEEMEREYEDIDPTAVIAADERGEEAFDVSEGIPTTESLYTNVITSKYLSTYKFTRRFGIKVYPVNVSKTYYLKWTEIDSITKKETPKTDTRKIVHTYLVERKYSYWEISSLGVYGLNRAVVNNGALPNESVTLTPNGYTSPTVSYTHNADLEEHITEPKIKPITLESETIKGDDTEPIIPDENWTENAEKSVKQIICKNDRLVFNNSTIMSDIENEKETQKPREIPDGIEEIGEDVFYKSNLVILGTLANGEYETGASVSYNQIVNFNAQTPTTTYPLEDVNPVIVHTPTVCDAYIQDNFMDNQMINPDKTRASLVLDKNFNISLSTFGSHRYIKGYEYRDYGKYMDSRMVKFPFDTFLNNSYIPAETWTVLSSDITTFYLPTWVNEGKYTIEFKSISINGFANSGLNKIEQLANLNRNNYVASDSIDVEVSGRIYGFNLYDVSDYPTWREVFRLPDSLKRTNFHYTIGTYDENGYRNGQDVKYTIPLINGSHPFYSTIGALKTGYVTRFSLTTVGDMYDNNDYINIQPKFYYVDSKGGNRQEVDIYYAETIQNRRETLVKMGGDLDSLNKKSIRTGDIYLGIPENELLNTALIRGMSLDSYKNLKRNSYTFMNIMIPESLRTFVGYKSNLPSKLIDIKVAKSVQHWYGEYYLPSEIHVIQKDFNLRDYISKYGSITYKEPFWLKDGYIIVNFNIETIQNDNRHLSYINAINSKYGYCNMWKREGFQYSKKDNKGNNFDFIDGDYVLYYLDKSVQIDYSSAGTH